MARLLLSDVIRFGRAVDDYHLACLEDLRPHDDVEEWRELTDAIDMPTIVGEDTYTREGLRT